MKPSISVLTIGHQSSGKTTLCAAITQVLASEPGCIATATTRDALDRGHPATRHLAAFPYETAARRYAHLDTSGNRKAIRGVARGAAGSDAAILVVSADQGVEAQTREHVLCVSQLGVEHLVVFMNKCDLVKDPAIMDAVEMNVRTLLSDCDLDGDDVTVVRGSAEHDRDVVTVVRGSAEHAGAGDPWRGGIVSMIDALERAVPEPVRDTSADPIMLIDELYGRRTRPAKMLVAGRILRGELEIGKGYTRIGLGDDTPTWLESMEVFRQSQAKASAGEQVGLMVTGPVPTSFERGHALIAKDAGRAARSFEAELTVLTEEEGGRHTPIFQGHQGQFHLGTASVTGVLSWGTMGINPGETTTVQASLWRSAFIEPGMPFIFRDGCDGLRRRFGGDPAWSGTAAFGRVTKVLADSP